MTSSGEESDGPVRMPRKSSASQWGAYALLVAGIRNRAAFVPSFATRADTGQPVLLCQVHAVRPNGSSGLRREELREEGKGDGDVRIERDGANLHSPAALASIAPHPERSIAAEYETGRHMCRSSGGRDWARRHVEDIRSRYGRERVALCSVLSRTHSTVGRMTQSDTVPLTHAVLSDTDAARTITEV